MNCHLLVDSTTNATTIVSKTRIQTTVTNIPSSTTAIVSMAVIQTTATNAPSNTTTHQSKPSMAISDNNRVFNQKLGLFFHSITYIHFFYLILALSFLVLGIFYSILAIRGEGINSSSIKNLNPLSLIFMQPYRIVNNPNTSNRLSFKFIVLIILFYFILSGIESSCNYLTYSFGINLKLSKTKSLFLQFCYLLGRLIDIIINYGWFLLDKKRDIISIKFLIFFRLIILFLICFLNLFQHIFNLLFFSIGFFLTSLSNLILYWIERNFGFNERFLRIILFTIIISESIFPIFLFYNIDYFIHFYLLIALCLLMILFLIISYASNKYSGNRLYRLLPTSMEMESQDNVDN